MKMRSFINIRLAIRGRRTKLAFILILFWCSAAYGSPLDSNSSFPAAFFGAPILIDPDLDLPAKPTIEQQLAAGQKLLDRARANDQTLDRSQELVAYFNDLVTRLLAAQDLKPPYPIVVHVSTEPKVNAYASAGGHIVIFSRIFEVSDNEAQLVAIIGHELSHEIHNDFLLFW